MKIEQVVCDRCKKSNAKTFRVFKDRKADGAGSMENWYYTFDLCSGCCGELLETAIETLENNTALEIIKKLQITTRVE